MTPTSLEQAQTASKLARTTLAAWKVAFFGRPLPAAIAEPLEALIHAGDQVTGAGLLADLQRKLRAGNVS